MEANITVLGTACVTPAVRINGDGIDGPKMTFDNAKLRPSKEVALEVALVGDNCFAV